MNIILNIVKNKLLVWDVTKVTLIIWCISMFFYFSHTGPGQHNHDYGGHLQYTEIITSKHHLPTPYEGWQTYHPPLYYLVNYLAAPSIIDFKDSHINFVRILSVCYGFISVWLISVFLKNLNLPAMYHLLTVLFITTQPKFAMIFSTYNNDSLVTMLIFGIIVLVYRLYNNWSRKLAIILFFITAAAFYTKYSSILAIGTILFFLCRNIYKLDLPDKKELRIIFVIGLAFFSFFPWLYFHNYKETHKFFPNNTESGLGENLAIDDDRPAYKVIFRIPFIQQDPHEWDDPWAHGYNKPESKKHDYLAFSYITSIFSENVWDVPGIKFVWTLFWLHLISIFLVYKNFLKTAFTKLAGYFIIAGHCSQALLLLTMKHPAACTMDFRYISWTWIAWAILYGHTTLDKSNIGYFLRKILFILVIMQIYTLFVITGEGT